MTAPFPVTEAWVSDNVSGIAAGTILGAAALAYPAAWAAIALYRRAVARHMRETNRPAADRAAATAPAVAVPRGRAVRLDLLGVRPSARSATPALLRTALAAPWRAAAALAVAGLFHAATAVSVQFRVDALEALPLRTAVVLFVLAWPIVPTTALLTAATPTAALLAALAYAAALAALDLVPALGGRAMPALSEIGFLWAYFMLLPTGAVLAFLSRRLRAVGPLVLAFMTIAVSGVQLLFTLGATARGLAVLGPLANLQGSANAVMLELLLAGFAAFAALGWLVARGIGRLYEAKRISDQSLAIDALWLVFTLAFATSLAAKGPAAAALGLLPFAVYLLSATITRSAVARLGGRAPPVPLLLLRVFGSEARSTRLLEAVGARWRYVGPIDTISSSDLAATTLEPHEFLDFLRGRLGRLFVRTEEDLRRRLDARDDAPDPDGRYRVDEFFCTEDTWRPALTHLLRGCRAVLMDLRGFTPAHGGCVFELQALAQLVPLSRVVLLADATTDLASIQSTLAGALDGPGPPSPDAAAADARVRVLQLAGDPRAEAGAIVSLLVDAAEEAAASGATAAAVPA